MYTANRCVILTVAMIFTAIKIYAARDGGRVRREEGSGSCEIMGIMENP